MPPGNGHPASVPANVPKGIERPGSFKSPDRPTPAVIPVNAGNMMAKTVKKPKGIIGLTGVSDSVDFAISVDVGAVFSIFEAEVLSFISLIGNE